MYKYLLTDALSYIIQKDYMHWKEFLALYQPHISGIKNTQPIVINFNSLLSKSNYEQIFKRLLMAHHLEKEDKDLQRIMKRDTKLEEVPNDFMDIYIRNAQENLTQLKRVYKNI